jgi:hypothetical protein
MDLTEFVVKYKRIIGIVAINVVGVLLLVLLVSLLKGSATGELPSPDAPPSQIVKSLADDGWKLQPKQARLEYVNNLIQVYAASPSKRDQFVQEINKQPDWVITQIQDNVIDVAKDQIVEDAMEFSKLTTAEQRAEFVNAKIQHMSNLKSMFRGQSSDGGKGGRGIAQGKGPAGTNGPDLAGSKLGKDVPVEPTKIYSKVLEQTTPAERAKVDNYISTVEGQVQRLKKSGMMK